MNELTNLTACLNDNILYFCNLCFFSCNLCVALGGSTQIIIDYMEAIFSIWPPSFVSNGQLLAYPPLPPTVADVICERPLTLNQQKNLQWEQMSITSKPGGKRVSDLFFRARGDFYWIWVVLNPSAVVLGIWWDFIFKIIFSKIKRTPVNE